MTTEERFERIEHLTAGIAEERRRDRDEYKTLWRDTQERQNRTDERMNRMADAVNGIATQVDRLAIETRLRMTELDEQLSARIETLVSAIGKLIATQAPAGKP